MTMTPGPAPKAPSQRGLSVIDNDDVDAGRRRQPCAQVRRVIRTAQARKPEARNSSARGRNQGRQSLEGVGLQQHVQRRFVKAGEDLAVCHQDSARCGSSGIDPKHRYS